MAILEYEPGAAFPGVIGRTAEEFTGTIHSVTVDVSGELIEDSEAELRAHMARQ
jgi:hypothetical protein